jgi:sporulation protein YlmC with PRC-barrel domain
MLSWTGAMSAAEPTPPTTAGGKIAVAHAFKMNKLRGSEIRNLQGEKLGTVEDFVMDMDKGTINYIALGTGGVLGLGEKLFAVPFNESKMSMDGSNVFFVVNVSKEKLKNLKGFDKDNWPENAAPGFAEAVNSSAGRPINNR